ncbi:MAG TPA: rRNA maturation RNase YbeY [Verrucomicrobiae bacterium]
MSVKPLNRYIVTSAAKSSDSTVQRFHNATIILLNRQRTRKINARALKKITEALLTELKIEQAELGINLVATPEMTLVNETFLKHKGSTDVITFDYQKSESKLHGELFICVDEAISQSKKFKTDWRSEVVRYIIHGVLHLTGFNDARAKAKQKMKREENRLLRELSKEFSLAQIAGPSKIPA